VLSDIPVVQSRIVGLGDTLVVELSDGEGHIGLAALPTSTATRESLAAALSGKTATQPAVAAALENALLDLRCRRLAVPQHTLFGGPIRNEVPLVAAVVIDPERPDEVVPRCERLLEALSARILSLHTTIGGENIPAIVDEAARLCGGDVALRLCLHGDVADDARRRRLEAALRAFTLECCYTESSAHPLDLGVTPVGLLAGGAQTEALRDLAPRGVVNSVLTDARTLGGVAMLETIAAVAQVFQLEVGLIAPTSSLVDLIANAHSAAAAFSVHGGVEVTRLPDFSPFGCAMGDFLRAGAIVLPDAPGLGLHLVRVPR